MAKYYVDYVGLNTFVYEPAGYNALLPGHQTGGSYGLSGQEDIQTVNGKRTRYVAQNILGISSGQIFLNNYKNARFCSSSHDLPTTASFFPALMLKRNGPYGYPSWKQTRASQNPLTRKQIKENVFTMVEEPGSENLVNTNGKLTMLRSKYSSIKAYVESPVSSRYKPFVVGAATRTKSGSLERFELRSSYGNETIFFNNNQLNNYYNRKIDKSSQYTQATGYYLNGGLEKHGSPIDVFEYFKYKECVYPPRIYQYKKYVRQRTTFSFPWRDNRANRIETVSDNGFGYTSTQSKWPLDPYSSWDTRPEASAVWGSSYGYDENNTASDGDNGILQNQFSSGVYNLHNYLAFADLDTKLKPGPLYSRKHLITLSSSVVSPNGMKIEGINYGTSMGDIRTDDDSSQGNGIPGGEAKWEAGSQSGLNPFYDTYDDYIDGLRQYGKDYSIVPEFRISEHVETYMSKGKVEEVANLFSLTGALFRTTDSSSEDFYKIYSTSEFMKHFEIVKKDHKEFVDPMSITLKCKALKKFLPYEGFYPAQRSVDLAKQFHSSYKDFVSISGSVEDFSSNISDCPYLFQNLMVPMFAPGIFFNTIKSGVAVDYPLIDSNVSLNPSSESRAYVVLTGSQGQTKGNFYLQPNLNTDSKLFTRRIPFEAVVEPEKYLAGTRVYCNEPHRFANNSGSVFWNGGGNSLYKLMAHNFLAETNNFFMKNDRYTTIVSKPSSDPSVGLAEANKPYTMRVKMYKSTDAGVLPKISGSGGNFIPPQYPTSSSETFTMYSRPSAFGPSVTYNISSALIDHAPMAQHGMNYSFTPPYYFGQAWADISFTPTETRKYSIQEIIASSSVKQWRHVENVVGDFPQKDGSPQNLHHGLGRTIFVNGKYNHDSTYETEALHLNASVNLFSQQIDKENSVDPTKPTTRWTIQTKFETPMLNFNHLSASNSIALPTNASQSVPRGMWHQYGRIEEDSTKGIFLQVDDVPNDWTNGWLRSDADVSGSLIDLCGFSTEASRLGQLKDSKTVFEAVVAIPFVQQEGQRYFFRISRNDVARAFSTPEEQNKVGKSVKEMLQKIRKYVLPPPVDFINNPQIDPFAMYVFEFKHTFSKQDLANIWQNLYPEIGQKFETAESSISHQLLAHELLGGGAVLRDNGTLDTNAIGNEIPDRVRWMVFKVKQRAKINYYEKIYGREDRLSDAVVSSQGQNVEISYNWPYDFFSLVELAKIEAETQFARRPTNADRAPAGAVLPIPRTDIINVTGKPPTNDLFSDAAAGNLPTLDEAIPTTATQPGAGNLMDPRLVGSTGAAFKAQAYQQMAQNEQMFDMLTSNMDPTNDMGGGGFLTTGTDQLVTIVSGMGSAGQVGPQMNYSVAGSAGPEASIGGGIEMAEAAMGFAAGEGYVEAANYGSAFISIYN